MKLIIHLIVVSIILVFAAGPRAAQADPWPQNTAYLPEWQMTDGSRSGKLLLSDSPEMVPEDGLLYQDKVEGSFRLFFYHVNATTESQKMMVVLVNSAQTPAHITVKQHGLGGPGYNWLGVGKSAMSAYLASRQPYQLTIPAGGALPLANEISDTPMLTSMLINGIYDLFTEGPVTVKVLMVPFFVDDNEFIRTAKVLDPDRYHLRGTFEGATRWIVPVAIYNPAKDGVVAITLADNQIDSYQEGIDALDGTKVLDYGNYGIVYHIALPTQAGGRIACYLAPIGGEYAGAIGIKYGTDYQTPVATPGSKLFFGGRGTKDYVLLGVFDTAKMLSIIFSPPGGSTLPVKIVVVPQ